MSDTSSRAPGRVSNWRRYRVLYALLAVCLAPVIASYSAYYLLPPTGRTNYGDLVVPQRPVPALALQLPDGRPFDVKSLRGRWAMVQVDSSDCGDMCQRKLWQMRQVRLTTGKDSDRIERIWLITDREPLTTLLMREYEGTLFLRADPEQMGAFLALPGGEGARLTDHIWLIDPLGNLMLRWPKNADPNRMRRDLSKLLKASQIG